MVNQPAAGLVAEDNASIEPPIIRPSVVTRLFRHRSFRTGVLVFGIIVIGSVLIPMLSSADPNKLSLLSRFQPPSWNHPFGTDSFGRSQLARVAYGAHLSLLIGMFVVLLNAVFGTLLGVVSGYFQRLDNVLMRITDALMAFPSLLLAITITAVFGPSITNTIMALFIVYLPRTARIVRASVLVIRQMEYVQAAIAIGAGHWHIIYHHIRPNILAPLTVQLSFLFAYAVIADATLSFLGLGAEPPTPTWGNIMADGRQYMREAAWIIAIPGCVLGATVLALNLIGDGLRDVLDPKLKI